MSAARSGPRRLAAVVAASLAVVAFLLGWAAPAWAHAELRSTEPAAGQQLDRAPSSVQLRFTEAVDPIPGAIRLVRGEGGDDGGDVAASVGRVAGDDSTVQLTPDRPLADGTYVVAWRVTSADSHPVRGAFTFRVGDAAEQDTAALVNRLLSQEAGTTGTGAALAAGRWLAYGGVLLAAGWLALAALGRAAVLRRAHVASAAAAGAVGTLLMVAAQAAALRSSWSAAVSAGAWGDVLNTRAGGWWGLRLVALAVVAAGAARAWTVVVRRPVAGAVALGLCVAAALGGHAQSGRWAAVGFAATVVHLVTAALWSAGLVTALLLARRGGAGGRPVRVPEPGPVPGAADGSGAAAAVGAAPSTGPVAFLRWFSPVALVAVAVLVASGVLNGVRQVGDVALLTDTDYGRLLVAKVVVVAALVAVAARSRRETQRGRAAGLRWPVRLEVALMGVVLLATAVLVNQRPAIAEQTVTETGIAVVGERTAQVVLDPARTGGTALHVYLTSPRGSLDRAEEIAVTATLAERDIGPIELETFPAGPNHVTNPDLDLPLPGVWTIEVAARYSEFELVSFRTTLNVRH